MLFTKLEREYFYLLLFQAEYYKDDNSEDIESYLRDFARKSIEEDYYEELELKRLPLESIDKVSDSYIEVMKNISKIDDEINATLHSWTVSRIGKVELALLRSFIYEYSNLDKKEDASMVINHLVSLAHKYGDDKSYKFVNGIMGNYYRERQ